MTIKDMCSCGAAIEIADKSSSWAMSAHETWLHHHSICRATRDITELTKETKK